MGKVARIIFIGVIVKCFAIIAESIKLTADSHIVIVVGGVFKGHSARGGKHAENVLIFAACCSCACRLIIIRKLYSLICKAVKGWGKLGVDKLGSKCLGSYKNEVFSLKEACIFILFRSGKG